MANWKNFIITAAIVSAYIQVVYAGTLSCTVTTTCSDTVIFRMQSTSNSHAELPSQSNYTQRVCCSGVTGLGTSCSGTYAIAVKLSGTTNAHAEQNTEANYANNACISVSSGSVSIAYQSSNCTGYDTTLASISGTTNAHVGSSTAYTTKICGTAVGASQTLTFSLSDTTIGFGNLSTSSSRWATGDLAGTSTAAVAHTITASTNATNGYVITVNGTTLTSTGTPGDTITAMVSEATLTTGQEEFGLRITASGGDGTVDSVYDNTPANSYALVTANFPDVIATDANGDDVSTTYSLYYAANISTTTEAHNDYQATLTYVASGSF